MHSCRKLKKIYAKFCTSFLRTAKYLFFNRVKTTLFTYLSKSTNLAKNFFRTANKIKDRIHSLNHRCLLLLHSSNKKSTLPKPDRCNMTQPRPQCGLVP